MKRRVTGAPIPRLPGHEADFRSGGRYRPSGRSDAAMRDDPERDFLALHGRHAPALGRLARHYEADPEARRDLEQEILAALWRALPSFRGECAERTWVYRVAHNVAATHVARAIRTRPGERVEAA